MSSRLGMFTTTVENANTVRISGRFRCNGTGAPTAVTGREFTVARTGVGVYVVTLKRSYLQVCAARVDLTAPAATVADARFTAIDVGSATPTATITNAPAGVATELADTAYVSFELELSGLENAQ